MCKNAPSQVLWVQHGYKKIEVIIIKFHEFAKAINKSQYRNFTCNREVFVEEMISSVFPSYKGAYTASTLQSFYKGTRPIYPSLNEHKIPFSTDKAKNFFSNFLRCDRLSDMLLDFGITSTEVSFDIFCNACAMQLKEFCNNSNDDVADVMDATCERLKSDTSYIGNTKVMPTDYELINEVKNLCPICRKQHLIKDCINRNYNITLIYPYDIEQNNPSLASIFNTYYPKPHHIN